MPDPTPAPVLLSGASGLVGRALHAHLAHDGIPVRRLVRGDPRTPEDLTWDPAAGQGPDPAALAGAHAIVHLAGEPIFGLWTPAKRQAIRDSRVDGTRLVAAAAARADPPPRLLLCASAIGYYGDTGHRPVDESGPPGDDFLAEVCRAWETAADPARDAGIRVIHARIGIVLDPRHGALSLMLPPFRLGLGGPVGSGRQFMSWIALDDLVRGLRFLLDHASLAGPANLVSPEPVPNAAFTRALGRALHRPAVVPLPAFAVQALLGRMGRATLLASTRALPRTLLDAGFAFALPDLPTALDAVLHHPPELAPR